MEIVVQPEPSDEERAALLEALEGATEAPPAAERLRVELAVLDALEQGRLGPTCLRRRGACERGDDRIALLRRRLRLDRRGHRRSLALLHLVTLDTPEITFLRDYGPQNGDHHPGV